MLMSHTLLQPDPMLFLCQYYFFFVLKMLCVRQSNGTYLKAMQFLKVRIKEEMHDIVST